MVDITFQQDRYQHNLSIKKFLPGKYHPKSHHDAQTHQQIYSLNALINIYKVLLKRILTSKIQPQWVMMTFESQKVKKHCGWLGF